MRTARRGVLRVRKGREGIRKSTTAGLPPGSAGRCGHQGGWRETWGEGHRRTRKESKERRKRHKENQGSDHLAVGGEGRLSHQLSVDIPLAGPTEASGRACDGQDLDRKRSQQRQGQERRQPGRPVPGRCFAKLSRPLEKSVWKAGQEAVDMGGRIRLQEERTRPQGPVTDRSAPSPGREMEEEEG